MTNPPDRLSAALAGRYRIERELGAGGMATVYLAHDLKHDRKVAIKILREELSASLGGDRFLREIRIAAQLQHPNILPLLDSGAENGLLFYVMPYVSGQSLRERITREGALPVHDAVRLITEVVDALAHAHELGVVHRDIKPDNVMLSGRHALVADFGVAKAVSDATGGHMVTTVGMAIGTPTYMSPEQAVADPHVDHRADIYAVGAMAYELLTGRPPFVGGSPQQVLAAHVTQAPEAPSMHRAGIAPALDAIILRCLAKQAGDRFQTAAELHAALEPWATSSGGITPAETARTTASVAASSGKGTRFAVALSAVSVTAIAAYVLLNRPPETAALQQSTQLTRSAGVQEMPRISSDGKAVAYSVLSPSDSVSHVEWRRGSDGSAMSVLSSLEPMGWSPDGDRLLVLTSRGIESVSALGGASTLLVAGNVLTGAFNGGVWARDGQRLAYVRGDSLLLKAADGVITLLGRTSDPHSLEWSPDGAWIAYISENSKYLADWNIAPSSLWIMPTTGGAPTRLTTGGALDASPTWAPDSRRLLFTSNRGGTRDIYQLNLDRRGRPKGDPVRVTTGLNASLISLSADGRQLAYSVATNRSNIWSVALPDAGSVSSRAAELVTSDKETIESIGISADGQWLIFDSDRAGPQQIFRRPLAGGTLQQVTRGSAPAFSMSISPDGRFIAFHTIANGLRRAFVASSEGGDQPVQVSRGVGPDERNPVWSPDGSRLGWQMLEPGRKNASIAVEVATRSPSGWGAVKRVQVPTVLMQAAWLGGGTLLGRDSLNRRLLAVDIDRTSEPPREIAQGLTEAIMPVGQGVISTDGRTLLIRNRRGIWMLPVGGGVPRQVVRFDDPLHPIALNARNFALHAGRLYFTLQDPQSNIWAAPVTGLSK